jgi:hypothetical protein
VTGTWRRVDGNYRERSVETVTRDLQRACAVLAEVARSVTEDDLARAGIGSDGTPRTVQALLACAGHELVHHDLDIRRDVEAQYDLGADAQPPH